MIIGWSQETVTVDKIADVMRISFSYVFWFGEISPHDCGTQLKSSERWHRRWHLPCFARSRPSRAQCFLRVASRCDPGNFTVAHEHRAYMIIVLCAAKMIPRGSSRGTPTPTLSVCSGYRSNTSTARNYFDELITLRRFLLTSAINFEFPQTFSLHFVLRYNDYYSHGYEYNTEILAFRGILPPCLDGRYPSFFPYRTSGRIIRYYFVDCSRVPILSAFSRA